MSLHTGCECRFFFNQILSRIVSIFMLGLLTKLSVPTLILSVVLASSIVLNPLCWPYFTEVGNHPFLARYDQPFLISLSLSRTTAFRRSFNITTTVLRDTRNQTWLLKKILILFIVKGNFMVKVSIAIVGKNLNDFCF